MFKTKSQNIQFLNLITIVTLIIILVGLFLFIGLPSISQDYPYTTIVIAGTNDIHGTYFPSILIRKDTMERYQYGGLQVLAQMIQIVKNQNPNRFLYLNAGDQFQGGFQSSPEISSGEIMTDYFDHMKTGASAPGNHQFDFGPQFLQKYLQKLNDQLLSANFIDQSFKPYQKQYLPLNNQKASRIFSFPIPPDPSINQTEIKIGVIGLATVQTYFTSDRFTQHLFPESYAIINYKQPVLREAKFLRQKGCYAIIIVAHVGNQCGVDSTSGIWTQQKTGNIENCKKDDEIFQLIDVLPQGTIDAIFQGHRHSTSHFFYKGIPILGNINGGYTFSLLHLPFKIVENNLFIDKTKIKIEGPIPVCEKIFQNTRKCEFLKEQDLSKAGNLVNWNFHGQKVQKDNDLSQLARSKWSKLMQPFQVQIVENFIIFPLQRTYTQNNPLGDLITNLLARRLKQKQIEYDFVFLNSGGFRTIWFPGIIRQIQINSMFPFPNYVTLFEVTGQNLKKIIEILQGSYEGIYPSWGLSQTLQKRKNENGYKSINLKLSDGTPVIDTGIYKGATSSFITGGKGLYNISQYLIKVTKTEFLLKQLIKQELKSMDKLSEKDLQNPSNLEKLIILNNSDINSFEIHSKQMNHNQMFKNNKLRSN